MIDLHRYRLHLAGAALALLSLLLVLLYLSSGERKPSFARALSEEFAPLPIPAEAFFPPEEPPIIPSRILSRERRSAWTAEDVLPFWTDPATLDPAPFQAALRTEVDRLYDSVR